MIADVGLVGRREQLAQMRVWIAEATEGTPLVVLLEGEAGVGKSRLVDEVLAGLAPQTRVLRGRCQEDASVPYLPLALALRSLVTGWDVGADQIGTDVESERGDRRLALFLKVSQTLLEMADSQLVVLALDDVHWADPATIELIGHVLASASVESSSQPVRLLIILSQRPTTPHAHVERAIHRFRREPAARQLQLSGLDQLDVQHLVEAATGDRPSRDLTRAVIDASNGNPLLVLSLLDRLDSFGALRLREGLLERTTTAELSGVPAGLDTLLLDRIDTVSQTCQQLLTSVAFLGDDVEHRDVALVSELDDTALGARLAEAAQAGILVEDARRYQFAHPQLRQLLYHRPGGRRRARLHAQLARRLEAGHQGDDSYAPRIAHHLRMAQSEGDPERLARHGLLAAAQAARVGAWADAWQLYEAVLEATEADHASPSGFSALLHHRAAIAAWWDHDNARALRHATAAVEQARALGDLERWGRAAITGARARWATSAPAAQPARDAESLVAFIETAGDTLDPVRAEAHAALVQIFVNASDLESARVHAEQARALVARGGDADLLRSIDFHLGYVNLVGLELDEAAALYRAVLERPVAEGDPLPSIWSAVRLGFTEWLQGREDSARDQLRQASMFAHQHAAFAEEAFALSCLEVSAASEGDRAEVERLAELTAVRLRWGDNPYFPTSQHFPALAAARAADGDAPGAHAALDELEEAGGRGVWRLRILVNATCGDERAALDALERRDPFPRPVSAINLLNLGATAAIVEAACLLETPQFVAPALDALEDACGRGVLRTPGWPHDLLSLIARGRTLVEQVG